jgi:hypothetical protein
MHIYVKLILNKIIYKFSFIYYNIQNFVAHPLRTSKLQHASAAMLVSQLPQLQHNHHNSMNYNLCEDGNTFWGYMKGRNF